MLTKKIYNYLGSERCETLSISFLLHCIFLLVLSLCFYVDENKYAIINIISSFEETEHNFVEVDVKEYKFDNTNATSFTDTELTKVDIEDSSLLHNHKLDINSPIDNFDILLDVSKVIDSNLVGIDVSGLSQTIGRGISEASSTGGALDRLTIEIMNHAQIKNVNVAWLLDSSVSLTSQRQFIHDRFDKILTELNMADGLKPINHIICSFGQSVQHLINEPTSDIKILKDKICSITIDESGIENTFNAIGEVCKKYKRQHQTLMVIVFTDEIGEDYHLLDSVSHFARMNIIPIYVVGNPAPFGKTTTQFRFVEFDSQYADTEKWVEIQQGPETLYDMTLNLRSLPIDDETLDSGYGSFALSKLCLDTGGIFFSVHSNRTDHVNSKKDISPLSSYISRFFDHNIMSQYQPDYRSISTQNKDISSSHIKQCLIKACSMPLDIQGEQILRFKAFNEGLFAEELGKAQRFSAKFEPKINEVYNILLAGESSFLSLKEKRWIVSYALAMGRILATKCRIESYNYILAEAKTGLKKKDAKNNIWVLSPSKEFQSTNSGLRKNYEASQKYLRYIVDSFPNTPWALIADEELKTPIGYFWTEEYQEPPKPNGGDGAGNNIPKDDMFKPKLIPKPQRKINKI